MNIDTFLRSAGEFIPKENIYTDQLRRLAWGTDAGFYRLTPQVVILPSNEEQVARLLALAHSLEVPVTFRAAGTSLSGQSITDSVLIVAGKQWEHYTLSDDYTTITMQPGIVGERVNRILKPYGRRFAPDPASLKSAMVGGIVMNNASGMSCGIHANSDRVLTGARLIFADGTVLDTASDESRNRFTSLYPEIIAGIERLKQQICTTPSIYRQIKTKYAIKNVVGLNLLPFITFDDPFDILLHLMVGSEGTLAFMSQLTMNTLADEPYKASAMLYFSDLKEACKAVLSLKRTGATAVELLDKQSLKAANDPTGEGLTALLVETRAMTGEQLRTNIEEISGAVDGFDLYVPFHFSDKEEEYARYWEIRSGIFPAVGGMRRPGTTCLIEDVAFPLEHLPEATAELQQLIADHGYTDACIYGHALEGNYHFIINQAFDNEHDIASYEALMRGVAELVVTRYHGSLKAEHGTGRNMAPYVEFEWGKEVFDLMKEVKQLLDPKNILNRGVIFNDDPQCHIRHLKPLPLTNPIVDKCIECGFCEVNCLTCGLTLSSRQRIVIRREIARLQMDLSTEAEAEKLEKAYRYWGNETCVADGLCSLSCPMKINMGDLTHSIRDEETGKSCVKQRIGEWTANYFSALKNGLRMILSLAHTAHRLLGTRWLEAIAGAMRTLSGKTVPLWNRAMPASFRVKPISQPSFPDKVVYFPSCINQTMGVSRQALCTVPLVNKTVALLNKACFEVVFPDGMDHLCCGTIWESKGMSDMADQKAAQLEEALWQASHEGEYPILCDQSPCLYRMRHTMKRLKLYEPVEFIHTYLLDRLEFVPCNRPVSVHITCSMRKMGLGDDLVALARRCSTRVFVPEEVGCCGFGGDKGFTQPEINRYALRKLKSQMEEQQIEQGYCNSRTCEIGLTVHSGVSYQSIVYLVDENTRELRSSF